MDFGKAFGAVERSVETTERGGAPARAVKLSRTFKTDVEDLWDAITNPARLPRAFLPVEGDLRVGGHYQLIGNAGGKILICERPARLSLTWEFGEAISWLDVHLAPEAEEARLTLIHTAPVEEHWETYGPGAAGAGWDLALIGMQFHLANPEAMFDEEAFGQSEDGKWLIRQCGQAWGKADAASGEDKEIAQKRAVRTTAFYLGDSLPDA
ncbi:SRPBCC family protein [Henriciella marina]|uniref:SRPBCC family protein n=1 Tax=Henriciella marina TaxID=453851 RepID=UPI00036B7B2E|nr:SRPBCC family protein [Henriciella marina]